MQTHCSTCAEKDALIASLRTNATLNMLNAAGMAEAIRTLPQTTTYTIVLCDIDRLKTINTATGNHIQTDRYLRAGLAVRYGEKAGQLHDRGDEFLFLLDDQARIDDTDPDAFVARIVRQLASQPLTDHERAALAQAQGVLPCEARLSATFATESGVTAAQVPSVVERLSCEVLRLKAARDGRVRVGI